MGRNISRKGRVDYAPLGVDFRAMPRVPWELGSALDLCPSKLFASHAIQLRLSSWRERILRSKMDDDWYKIRSSSHRNPAIVISYGHHAIKPQISDAVVVTSDCELPSLSRIQPKGHIAGVSLGI